MSWLIDWWVDWLIVLIGWFVDWLFDRLVDCLFSWLIDCFGCLVDWLSGWLFDCLNDFVDWLICGLIGWSIGDWLIVCLINWFIDCFDWLTERLIDSLIGWLVDCLVDSVVIWLTQWLVDLDLNYGLISWLTDLVIHWLFARLFVCLVDWLTDWLVGWFWRIVWLFRRLIYCHKISFDRLISRAGWWVDDWMIPGKYLVCIDWDEKKCRLDCVGGDQVVVPASRNVFVYPHAHPLQGIVTLRWLGVWGAHESVSPSRRGRAVGLVGLWTPPPRDEWFFILFLVSVFLWEGALSHLCPWTKNAGWLVYWHVAMHCVVGQSCFWPCIVVRWTVEGGGRGGGLFGERPYGPLLSWNFTHSFCIFLSSSFELGGRLCVAGWLRSQGVVACCRRRFLL